MEKETLKDPEQRLNERNIISLPQLPSHPHEDNRLYLSRLVISCFFTLYSSNPLNTFYLSTVISTLMMN